MAIINYCHIISYVTCDVTVAATQLVRAGREPDVLLYPDARPPLASLFASPQCSAYTDIYPRRSPAAQVIGLQTRRVQKRHRDLRH